MNRLLLTLGKLLGVLLISVGVLVGLVGLGCTIGIAVEWHQMGRLTESDRNGGLACAGLTIANVLILWAGVVVLRKCGMKYTPASSCQPLSTPLLSTPQEGSMEDAFSTRRFSAGIYCCGQGSWR